MRTQKILSAVLFIFSTVSLSASAAIINTVDFPAKSVQNSDQVTSTQDEQTNATDMQN